MSESDDDELSEILADENESLRIDIERLKNGEQHVGLERDPIKVAKSVIMLGIQRLHRGHPNKDFAHWINYCLVRYASNEVGSLDEAFNLNIKRKRGRKPTNPTERLKCVFIAQKAARAYADLGPHRPSDLKHAAEAAVYFNYYKSHLDDDLAKMDNKSIRDRLDDTIRPLINSALRNKRAAIKLSKKVNRK